MKSDYSINTSALGSLLAVVLALSGCGGSGSSSSAQGTGEEQTPPAATVTLTPSASTINAGSSVSLTWSSTNATSCTASGGWSGSKTPSGGTESVGPLQQDTNFTLSCSGAGGGGVQQVLVQVDTGAGVSVSLTASPQVVATGSTTTLDWSSTAATTCTAGGAWSGDQSLNGMLIVGPLNADTSYQLTCDGPSGSAVAMVTVQVLDKTVRWVAPTENVDGSPLTDLAGYRIHWGVTSRNYTGSHTINSAGITEWEATVSPGDYYFALTAFDSDDNESGYSNEVLKTIP